MRYQISNKHLSEFAWMLWGMMFVFVAAQVLHNDSPDNSNECWGYARATSAWWARENLYDTTNIDGFLYLPQAAIIYTPFAVLNHPIGDVLWRLVGLGAFCHGLWRMSKLLSPSQALRVFAIGSFIALAPTYNALRNGQANLQIAALMLHATVDLVQHRWWRAAIWLTVGFAVKPIVLVMILLAAALYRPMSWRLAIALAVLLLSPFATGGFHYVLTQYQQCRIKLSMSSQPDRAFSDLRGLFWSIGCVIPMWIYFFMQLFAAAATLALCFIAFRRWNEPAASTFVVALAACYLMLFNPRTEGNSYVILTPMIALPAALLFLDNRRRLAAWVLVALSAWLISYPWTSWGYRLTVHWMKPLACIIFIILLLHELLRNSGADWPEPTRPRLPAR
ncbi:MAG: glycosyltransferase family 87 protein [Tepidisphaeraceae bacterium]